MSMIVNILKIQSPFLINNDTRTHFRRIKMAFIVKRTFVRTDDSTTWPWEAMSSADTSALVSARSDNNVTQTVTASDNGLVVSYTESYKRTKHHD